MDESGDSQKFEIQLRSTGEMARRLDRQKEILDRVLAETSDEKALVSHPMEGSHAGETRTFAGIEFVWCPAGTFQMGSPESEEGRWNDDDDDETPHQVTLTRGFWMAQTPVTQRQWLAVVGGENPSVFKTSGLDAPVERVIWEDAVKFCAKLNQEEPDKEWEYALPTEAQWEYACRAGTTGPYNVDGTALMDLGWFEGNSESETHPVQEKNPNAWGLYDMHGNVWEWCEDYWYSGLGSDPRMDPQGAQTGDVRVMRGGSWLFPAENCRSACRGRGYPGDRSYNVGFRPVRKKKQS